MRCGVRNVRYDYTRTAFYWVTHERASPVPKTIVSVSVALVLALFTVLLAAQDTYTGQITSDNPQDEYLISLTEGEGVILTVTATSGGLDTVVALQNGKGNEVASNDDFNYPDSTDSQLGYVIPRNGEYTVVVSAFDGESEGDYTLTVRNVTAAQAEAANDPNSILDDIGEPDETYSGFMGDTVADDRYPIPLESGQGVVIDLSAVGDGDLDPILVLEDANGNEVMRNDDYQPGESLNSRIVYVAESSATYTAVVSNYPDSGGDYALTITYITGEVAESLAAEIPGNALNSSTPDRTPDQEYSGNINDGESDDYTLNLSAGDGLIAALYGTGGGLDPILTVTDPNGVSIIRNDDRGDYDTTDSQVAFNATVSGSYTFTVSHYTGTSGDYRLALYFATSEEVANAEPAMRVVLSGLMQALDTDHFRIHYTTEGDDAVTPDYVQQVAETVESVYRVELSELGWSVPPSDLMQGGDGRIDVYLRDLTDLYGYIKTSSPLGDNPNTALVETGAQPAFLVLDNDYSDEPDAERALRATAAHEFHHIIQYGYDSQDFNWYYESTASWMETVVYPQQELANIYIDDVFRYPEACLGGDGEADLSGNGLYGHWLMMDYMERTLGQGAVRTLWEQISTGENWEPFENTLAAYSTTVPEFVSGYYVNNLVRDYALVDAFDTSTVWLEDTISQTGDFRTPNSGVQELAANYVRLTLQGEYRITTDSTDLLLFMVGIEGDSGFVYSLGSGATVKLGAHADEYLIVFNPQYDDDLFECDFTSYTLKVAPATDGVQEVAYTVNAANYRDLGN